MILKNEDAFDCRLHEKYEAMQWHGPVFDLCQGKLVTQVFGFLGLSICLRRYLQPIIAFLVFTLLYICAPCLVFEPLKIGISSHSGYSGSLSFSHTCLLLAASVPGGSLHNVLSLPVSCVTHCDTSQGRKFELCLVTSQRPPRCSLVLIPLFPPWFCIHSAPSEPKRAQCAQATVLVTCCPGQPSMYHKVSGDRPALCCSNNSRQAARHKQWC